MKVRVLSSGSKGNTTYIECGETKIIIDMGNSCKYVVNALKKIGVKGSEIDAILITHTHSDHIKGLEVFLKKFHSLVYMTDGMISDLAFVEHYKIINGSSFAIGEVVVDVIKTSHDALGSVGYVVNGEGKRVAYITDTGYINHKYFEVLSNCDLYVMESNHDVEMLHNSRYPFRVRQRIFGEKGHLSNYDSSRYLASFIGDRTKCVVLAHLSLENNTEELAYQTFMSRLEEEELSIDKVIIARQDEETELIEV